MLKKRLIYTLLYDSGQFMLSRNFRLQRVGNIKWVEKNYNFPKIAKYLDELIVLNVSRNPEESYPEFCDALKQLVGLCFIPVAAGGGIRDLEHVKMLFNSGADKVVVNSSIWTQPDLVQKIADTYGKQCVVASIDCKEKDGMHSLFYNCGQQQVEMKFADAMEHLLSLELGEIYVNSINRDGTGQGYDVELLSKVAEFTDSRKVPLIAAGGAGNHTHLIEAIQLKSVDAVATANLFNFVGDAIPISRNRMFEADIPMARW